MSKAAEMAKVSTKGSFHLMWGLVVSTIISAVGAIAIASLLGESEYGIYGIALIAPNLIQAFRDWGMDSAITKYTAQYKAENKTAELRKIFVSGLIFETSMGLALTALSFLLSGFLAAEIFRRPAIAPLIETASLLILAGALFNAATAAFIGFEKMELRSVTVVCQSIIKTVLIITLVLSGFGSSGAVIGNSVGFLIASIIGVFLMWTLYRSLPSQKATEKKTLKNIGIMLKYGMPLSISAIISVFLTQFYYLLMAIYAEDAIIGNYNVALNFVLLITFVATPITTVLFPAFSKLDRQKDKETLKNVFRFSVKYSALVTVPVSTIIISLSQPAVSTIFGSNYSEAPLFLALSAITYLLSAFGTLIIGNLLAGQGETTFSLKLTLLQAAIGFPLGFVLISRYSVVGLIVTTLIAGIPGLIVALMWGRKHYALTIDLKTSMKILLCSAISATLTYTSVTQISLPSWMRLVLGVFVFLITFVITILLTSTIDKSDLTNMREMVSALGVLQRPVNFLLDLMERVMNKLKG